MSMSGSGFGGDLVKFLDARNPQMQGLLQGLGQASMPSRLPVPFGAVLGQAAAGLMQGKKAQQEQQDSDIRNKYYGAQTTQLEEKAKDDKALRDARNEFLNPKKPPPYQMGSNPQLLTTDQIAQKFGQQPADDGGFNPTDEDLRKYAAAGGDIAPYINLRKLNMDEYDTTPRTGVNPATGKVGEYLVRKDGGPEHWLGAGAAPKIRDVNGQIIDDNTVEVGKVIPKQADAPQAPMSAGRFVQEQTLRDAGNRTQPFERTNLLIDSVGHSLGAGRYNKQTGELEYKAADGSWTIAPAGARPAPISTGGALAPKQYQDLKISQMADVQGLDRLQQYANTVGGANIGIKRWADQVSQNAKTAFGSGKLSPEELNRAVANNQLQGLLGLFRVDVVGPGVMTETDAQRVLQALGGDVNNLQNPEVVAQALGQMYKYKYERVQLNQKEIERNAPFYNQEPAPLTIAPELQMGAPASSAAPQRQTQAGGVPALQQPQIAPVGPPPGAIQMLKMNPGSRAQFDAKYGAGAAAKILGK